MLELEDSKYVPESVFLLLRAKLLLADRALVAPGLLRSLLLLFLVQGVLGVVRVELGVEGLR